MMNKKKIKADDSHNKNNKECFKTITTSDKNCVYKNTKCSVFNIHWLGNIINQKII